MTLLFIFCCFVYLIRITVICVASYKSRQKQKEIVDINNNLPFVSVIVPAKDEENNITDCLEALLISNYPKDKFEIVVVNDRSIDKTGEIVSSFVEKYSNVKQKNIFVPSELPNLKGKAGAIQAGIDDATGNIFLMTDADCKVNKNWILAMVSNFLDNNNIIDKNIGMVCSYTTIKSKDIFDKFQDSEWIYMSTCASAGIGLNKVLGCFGNNLAVTREAYEKIGGYKNINFCITEDYILLKTIFDAGYKIKYICDKNANVETLPVETLKDYFRQHKRWALGGTLLGLSAVLYVFSTCCITASFIIGILEMNWIMITINFLLRLAGDIFVLFPIYNILNKRYLKKWVIPFIGLYSIVEVLVPFTLINRKVIWKNQIFNIKVKNE